MQRDRDNVQNQIRLEKRKAREAELGVHEVWGELRDDDSCDDS